MVFFGLSTLYSAMSPTCFACSTCFVADATALSIIRKELKKRQDSVEAFEKGGRMDLADKEKAEAEILAVIDRIAGRLPLLP